jgi:thiamine-monophosphate kinase
LGVGFGRALGWKLLGSGLSDLAAMGRTTSRWAMVYLAAPSDTKMSFLMDLYRGVKEASARGGAVLAGGDTVRGRDMSLVVAVGGQMAGPSLVRTGARPGDALCVAGEVGDAQMGLEVLLGRKKISKTDQKYFVTRFFRVEPRFDEAAALAGHRGVTSLMDLSDPLGSSVNILTAASNVGAVVGLNDVPVSPRLAAYKPSAAALLSAGEDYGLLFTVKPSQLANLKKKIRFSVIGQIRPRAQGVRFYFHNKQVRSNEYFEHFS